MRKANLIVGMGPVQHEDINKHMRSSKSYNKAKIKAAEEFLREKLKYNEEELDRIEIKETQMTKDDTIYMARTKTEDIK